MDYQAPADRIIFTGEASDVDALVRGDGVYVKVTAPPMQNPRVGAQPQANYRCDAWKNFPPGGWEPGPAFLHSRTAACGEERLVALELSPIGDVVMIYCQTFKPVSFSNANTLVRRGGLSPPEGVYH